MVDNSSTATVRDRLTFNAFGLLTAETNAAYWGAYTWEGMLYDTGLYYAHARFYDPSTSRWISQDPLGFDAGDSNLYRYVQNSSTAWADPSGLQGNSPVAWDWQKEAQAWQGYQHPRAAIWNQFANQHKAIVQQISDAAHMDRMRQLIASEQQKRAASYVPPINNQLDDPYWYKRSTLSFTDTIKAIVSKAKFLFVEPVAILGDLGQAAGAGLNNLFGGKPYVPNWWSDAARNLPLDVNQQGSYFVKLQLENLQRGLDYWMLRDLWRSGSKAFQPGGTAPA